MDKATDQQVLALVRSPEQLEAGQRWPLAEILAVRDQGFGIREVVRLMDQRQIASVELGLDPLDASAGELQAQAGEQLLGRDPVFHGDAAGPLQHHGESGTREHQGG